MPNSIEEARDALLREREDALSEIRRLDTRVKELDAAIKPLNDLLNKTPESNGRRSTRRTERVARPAAVGRAPRKGSIGEAIESYLETQGRKAVHADQILAHLQEAGRAPGGENPRASVQTTLRELQKRGRVNNIGRNRWRKLKTAEVAAT